MKIGFVSLGCVKNRVDSERMMGLISHNHHELVVDPREAECIIVNTCGFIDSAKEEAINVILEMAELKQSKLQKLIVTGCLAERYYQQLQEELPEVDLFIRISDYDDFNLLLTSVLGTEFTGNYNNIDRLLSTQPWLAYLKIAEGCSNRCHFCAIPLIRGPYRSYPLEDLVEEARKLALKGVRELVLIAQDTTRYGEDIYGERKLLGLLEKLSGIAELRWIRVLYMYPDEIDEKLIYGIKKLPKVLSYFDIPMQHGSKRLLSLMNRRGSIEEIKTTISTIRQEFEQAVLRTTLIVGYPGETEEDFQKTLDFVTEVKWDRLGAFTYSREEDTVAYELPEQIPEEVQLQRYQRLMSLQQEISTANNQRLPGKKLEVLVEAYDALRQLYRCRSIYNAPDGIDGLVYVRTAEELKFGSFIEITVTAANQYDLFGEYHA